MTEPTLQSSILGRSDAAERLRRFVRRAAAVDAPVLLTGETGTGKSLVARCIHYESARAGSPMVPVNCAAVPESLFESEFFGHTRGAFTGAARARKGLWEQAEQGTLFLDEIAEMPARLQAKLLGVIEDGQVRRVGGERVRRPDVRLIAATNEDLGRALREGRIRLDLVHRLAVLTCRVPALRAREDDAVALARHFLETSVDRYGLSPAYLDDSAVAEIRRHAWPGNVRELAHVIEATLLSRMDPGTTRLTGADIAGALSDRIPDARPGAVDRPSDSIRPSSRAGGLTNDGSADGSGTGAATGTRYRFDGPPEEEREMIRRALEACRWNRTRAARTLGMSRTTLRKKLRAFGLEQERE